MKVTLLAKAIARFFWKCIAVIYSFKQGMNKEKLIATLKGMKPGVERDLYLFHWKHRYWPAGKIFSTLHGGDCAGNFLLAISNKLAWADTIMLDGKKIVLEYERNFNDFVKWFKEVKTDQ